MCDSSKGCFFIRGKDKVDFKVSDVCSFLQIFVLIYKLNVLIAYQSGLDYNYFFPQTFLSTGEWKISS